MVHCNKQTTDETSRDSVKRNSTKSINSKSDTGPHYMGGLCLQVISSLQEYCIQVHSVRSWHLVENNNMITSS